MTLQQLLYLAEIANRGLSFSSAAASLRVSQPAISKQIRLLEEELAVNLFVRSNGSRIVELTEPGRRIVEIANLMLRQVESVKSAATEFTNGDTGRLNIASTFTFARYVLPQVFRRFMARYPNVALKLRQGTADQVVSLVATGEADIAVTTRPAGSAADLILVDYCTLPRALIVPRGHPLMKQKRLSLKAISLYPLITLDSGSLGQVGMRETFTDKGLTPRIIFTGVDVELVKAFVEAGLGIAVLPAMSYEAKRDRGLRTLDVNHLFEPHTGCVGIRKEHYLRGFAYDFIEILAPDRRGEALRQAFQLTK